MQSSVATFTVLYRTSPLLLTFNFLPIFYENPVHIDGRMDRLSLKIRQARELSDFLVEILTGFVQKIQFDVLLPTVTEEYPSPDTCPQPSEGPDGPLRI